MGLFVPLDADTGKPATRCFVLDDYGGSRFRRIVGWTPGRTEDQK